MTLLKLTVLTLAAGLFAAAPAQAQPLPPTAPPLQALPSLDVAAYMGTWYQVAWIPNRFQKQCVSDTAATDRARGDGSVEVLNRCKLATGSIDDVLGVARPPAGVARIEAGKLMPARLRSVFCRRGCAGRASAGAPTGWLI